MVTAEIVKVTPEVAKQWLENGMYRYQRPLKERHVAYLSNEMIAGRFKQDTVVRFGLLNGAEILTDGQHRLTAMVNTYTSHTMVVIRTTMKDEEELAENYIEIDINAYRTWADAFRALAGVRGVDLSLTMPQINALKGAMELIYRGFMSDGIRASNTLMFEKSLEWLPHAQVYFSNIKGVSTELSIIMRRMHLVAIGIATIKFAENHSPLQFWQQVALDDGIRADDIRKLLHNRLLQSRVQSSRMGERNMTPKQVLWYATRAWNAWVQNEKLALLKLPKDTPLILYTPFDYSMTIAQYRKCFEESDWGKRWQ